MRRRTSLARTYNLPDWQRIVVPGRRAKRAVVGPGRVKVRTRHVEAAQIVDLRPSLMYLSSPALTTADGATVRVSATAVVRVVDPVRAVRGTASAQGHVLERAQTALADVVGRNAFDVVVRDRALLGDQVLALVHDLDACGVEMASFEIRDVTKPGERARSTANGSLRSVPAAVRGLANAAGHSNEAPAMFQLRMVQRLERPGA